MNHPHQHLYPILCNEFGTRFFDADLVDAVITANKEAYDDPSIQHLIGPDQKPFNWESMSLREQVLEQISFVSPPPRGSDLASIEREQSAEEAWASRVVAEIEAIQRSHHSATV
jgi:hypothetical protein